MLEVLRNGVYVLGPKVKEFEEKAADYLGAKETIGCANGSDALYLALLALDIKAGDEVITTPFTYIATAEAISQIGAKPVFADINIESFNIDPDSIESKITNKTKAIIVVHLYGQCCDMDKIMAIAKKYNLRVIEDAAQAFGATCNFNEKRSYAGAMADIGTFSFYPTKNLACAGDGGLLSTNSQELADRLRKIRVHGTVKRYYHDELGVNSRLDEIQAAILLVKLKYIDAWNEHRAKVAAVYDKAFAELVEDGILVTPKLMHGCEHIYHQYSLRINSEKVNPDLFNRDALKAKLLEAGIASEIYYPLPLHMQDLYKYLEYEPEDLPNALRASNEILCLPVYAELDLEDARTVASAVKEIVIKSVLISN